MSTNIKYDPSCMDDFDPASMDANQAQNQIINTVNQISTYETLPIRESLGRVVATEVQSKINVPGHTNSAMDGYAIYGEEIPNEGTKTFIEIGTAFAGKPFTGHVNKGECVRIMTGAVMPNFTDTVIMQEHVEKNDNIITINSSNKSSQNVRLAGEDIAIHETVLGKGKLITPAELGLLASVGIPKINVFKKIRVAFFSTGDELRSVGTSLEIGQIYDSNRYTLFGMLHRLSGIEIIDMGVVKDNQSAVENAFSKAAKQADVIITSGGVSVGEADFVKEILEKIGQVNFWKVAMKPGRPLAFGKINDAWFFGLPGNPVSVMVTFYMFVQPALRKMMGINHYEPMMITATCTSTLRKRPGRIEYQRGIYEKIDEATYEVQKTGAQGSGILRSMSDANCFIILPMESEGVKEGDAVLVLPFIGIV